MSLSPGLLRVVPHLSRLPCLCTVHLPHLPPHCVPYSTHPINHYDTLGVKTNATTAQIKAAYYKLSKTYHPDVNKSQGAQKKFSDIATAYEVLGSTHKRKLYNRGLLHPHHSRTGHNPSRYPPKSSYDPTKFQSKRKTGHFGQTNFYNYEEYYRQHYGDSIGKEAVGKEAAERMDEVERKRKQRHSLHGRIYYSLLLISGITFIIRFIAHRR